MFKGFIADIKPLSAVSRDQFGLTFTKHVAIKDESHREQDITVQFKEDDLVVDCNHAGYTLGIITGSNLSGNHLTGGYDIEDTSEEAYICDKCHAWSYDTEEWNE